MKLKIILTGTNHSRDESEEDVKLEYAGDDDWSFTIRKEEITISDLQGVMDFLRNQFNKVH